MNNNFDNHLEKTKKEEQEHLYAENKLINRNIIKDVGCNNKMNDKDDSDDVINKKLKEITKDNNTTYTDVTRDFYSTTKISDFDKISSISYQKQDNLILEAKNSENSSLRSETQKSQNTNFLNHISDSQITRENFKKSIDKGYQFRQKANLLLKQNKFHDALLDYLNAVNQLNSIISIKNDILNITNINLVRMECFNGIAVCYLLLKDYNKVLEYTNEVLAINSNNFTSLSYRAKALIALNQLKEAVDVIKLALSIKYSKNLITLLKEIEDKIGMENSDAECEFDVIQFPNRLCSGESKTKSTNSLEKIKIEDKNFCLGSNNSQNNSKPNRHSHSIFSRLFKFIKILSLNCFDFLKRYKTILMILIALWIIIFRIRLKNKLKGMLQIKFN